MSTDSLIDQFVAFARAENPYVIRHDQMKDLAYIEDKKGYQDFVVNRLYDPIAPEYLTKMKKLYPDAPESLWALYQKSNGATFFAYDRLPKNELGGFYFLPMEYWRGEEVKDLAIWVNMDDEEYETNYIEEDKSLEIYGMPPWFDDVLVLGGFEASPEQFYMPTTGELAGNILMFEHDEHRNHRIAENFEEFLSLLINHPADLMCLCGGNYYYNMIGYGNDQQYTPISEEYSEMLEYEWDDEEDDEE